MTPRERSGALRVLRQGPSMTAVAIFQVRSSVMNKDTMKGMAKDAKGSVKRAVGKATGNERMSASGAGDKIVGKTQKAMGKAKDEMRRQTRH